MKSTKGHTHSITHARKLAVRSVLTGVDVVSCPKQRLAVAVGVVLGKASSVTHSPRLFRSPSRAEWTSASQGTACVLTFVINEVICKAKANDVHFHYFTITPKCSNFKTLVFLFSLL